MCINLQVHAHQSQSRYTSTSNSILINLRVDVNQNANSCVSTSESIRIILRVDRDDMDLEVVHIKRYISLSPIKMQKRSWRFCTRRKRQTCLHLANQYRHDISRDSKRCQETLRDISPSFESTCTHISRHIKSYQVIARDSKRHQETSFHLANQYRHDISRDVKSYQDISSHISLLRINIDMTYQEISWDIKSYQVISRHIKSYLPLANQYRHDISSHIKRYQVISSHIMTFHEISSHIKTYLPLGDVHQLITLKHEISRHIMRYQVIARDSKRHQESSSHLANQYQDISPSCESICTHITWDIQTY